MFLGKSVRLNRLINPKSGRILVITVDHSIARGVLPGLEDICGTLAKIVAGGPDAVTMHKGIAEKCFEPYAGRTSLILKCTSFSPYQPTYDTWVTDVEEAVRFGADAASVGVIIGGEHQPEQLRTLGLISKQCALWGMPLVAHIYPRGEMVDDKYSWKNVGYAVRAGAELGVDIVKTSYTGSPETFAKVVAQSPAKVVVAGGEVGETIEDYLRMTRDICDAGAAGVTYGRFVWQSPNPTAVIRALRAIIHDDLSAEAAIEIYHRELAGTGKTQG